MAKKRSENQKKEDVSRVKFEDRTVERWITEDLDEDYGIDLLVTQTKDVDGGGQEVDEPFFVQLKSTESLNNSLGYSVSKEDLKMWMNQDLPVLLAVYVFEEERFYWEFIQNFVWEELEDDYGSWEEEQGSYTINFSSESLNNLDVIEDESAKLKSRIIKKKYLSSDSFEGINVDNESELKDFESKNLANYKKTALLRAGNYLKSADKEKAAEKFHDIYESPETDEAKLRAIIGILSTFNPISQEENISKIEYAREGAELANEIDKESFYNFFKIEEQLGLFLIYSERMKGAHITRKIQEGAESSLAYLVNEEVRSELQELSDKKEEAVKEINERLDDLIETGTTPLIITSISNIVQFLALDTSYMVTIAAEDKEKFVNEELETPKIVESAEALLDISEDSENRLALLGSLSFYNYYVLEAEKAEEYAKEQLELAKEIDDEPNKRQAKTQLEQIDQKPNPYIVEEEPSEEEMTTEEYQDMLRGLMKLQNLDYEGDDTIAEALRLGLEDADPSKYFRECENIRIAYVGTSPLGKSIGLPTLGNKIMMCKHQGKILQGSSLETMFGTIKEHCEDCDECEPRSEDWECTVEWVKKQEEDDELREIVEGIKSDSRKSS